VNGDGAAIPATTSVTGTVLAVRNEADRVLLSVNGREFPFSDVLSVRLGAGS
jgi:hypothetical protein